jgi:hypothetical protein
MFCRVRVEPSWLSSARIPALLRKELCFAGSVSGVHHQIKLTAWSGKVHWRNLSDVSQKNWETKSLIPAWVQLLTR